MRSPFSPLLPTEIEQAADRALAAVGPASVVSVGPAEPPKELYLAWREGGAPPARAARVVLADGRGVTEATVPLEPPGEPSLRRFEGAHPPIGRAELVAAGDAVLADERFQAALGRRGVEDLDLVHIDVLPGGAFGHPLESEHRLARAVAFVRDDPTANPYAHPVEHVLALVDLDDGTVLDVEDGPLRPVPAADGEYRAQRVPARNDLRPFSITQPEGVSFTVADNEIRWHRWTLYVSLDHQEGLVLHDVRYDGRPILYRGSCAEMVVPYGEPDPLHSWRNYFDAGEVGLGRCANSLSLGCDCVGEIAYLDAHLYRDTGVYTIPNAICIHEEDAGTLWKHTDRATGEIEIRRGRRLVLNSMSTVGNYEYAFRWYLHLDGRIEVEVELHGIVSTIAVAPGEQPLGSNLIDAGLGAPNHQHLFCFRLDLDVDGTANSVAEVDSVTVPVGAENPIGNAFTSRTTPLRTELTAKRDADPQTSRAWRVESRERRNVLDKPTAYALRPGSGTATLLASEDSSIARRAAFARHNLWVTRFDQHERHPAGSFPYQRGDADGLSVWTQADRELEEEDVVLWYTAGITHFVKPEDWPIMPVHKVGFGLEPVGFFDRNPTLDLPAPAGGCCAPASQAGDPA